MRWEILCRRRRKPCPRFERAARIKTAVPHPGPPAAMRLRPRLPVALANARLDARHKRPPSRRERRGGRDGVAAARCGGLRVPGCRFSRCGADGPGGFTLAREAGLPGRGMPKTGPTDVEDRTHAVTPPWGGDPGPSSKHKTSRWPAPTSTAPSRDRGEGVALHPRNPAARRRATPASPARWKWRGGGRVTETLDGWISCSVS